MASYNVFGYLKTPDNKIVQNAKIYPYFKQVSSSSPSSKWADTPYLSDSFGYYTFDLGDSQLIGTESSILKGQDKVYIAVVWNENDISNQDLNSLDFTHCAFIDHTTIVEDFVEINLTVEPKRLPVLSSITFPQTNLLTRHSYSVSETSYADYTWKSLVPYTENSTSQKLLYDLVPIFGGHKVINTIYNWGEAHREVANSTSDSYEYQIAGIYNICVTIREQWNTELTSCLEVKVKYNKPNIDFNWSPTVTNSWEGNKLKGADVITFF